MIDTATRKEMRQFEKGEELPTLAGKGSGQGCKQGFDKGHTNGSDMGLQEGLWQDS